MAATKREYTLGIWALALGYFLSYVPYSGLAKAATSGLLTRGLRIPASELLPSAAVSTAVAIFLFITIMGWWQHGRKRRVFGLNVLFPRRQTFISGIGFAAIIVTTTLAYSFSGVSIILALVLMRAGTLMMSPIIDRFFHRRVRWFSWAGLILSLIAVVISLNDTHNYQLSTAVLINLAIYLAGYAVRIPNMTRIAKTGERKIAFGYFVEEQAVAMPLLVLAPLAMAAIGRGDVANHLRFGFAHLFSGPSTLFGWAIGLFYAALGIFLSFIYLDRRENTFCMPLFACSSLLSGIVASYLLAWWFRGPTPSRILMSSACLLITALLVMSPLHHLPLYIRQLRNALSGRQLVLVEFVRGSANDIKVVTQPAAVRFITIDIHGLRQVFRKQPS
jgi:drug/metabolite transporter (DMT)-like permease